MQELIHNDEKYRFIDGSHSYFDFPAQNSSVQILRGVARHPTDFFDQHQEGDGFFSLSGKDCHFARRQGTIESGGKHNSILMDVAWFSEYSLRCLHSFLDTMVDERTLRFNKSIPVDASPR